MAYRVILAPRAQKDLAAIRDTRESQRLRGAILRLEEDPRPRGALKLSGSELWRIRIGHFRVMYEIEDERVIVRIVRVRHRREAYRN